jgi:hypothetical protein
MLDHIARTRNSDGCPHFDHITRYLSATVKLSPEFISQNKKVKQTCV